MFYVLYVYCTEWILSLVLLHCAAVNNVAIKFPASCTAFLSFLFLCLLLLSFSVFFPLALDVVWVSFQKSKKKRLSSRRRRFSVLVCFSVCVNFLFGDTVQCTFVLTNQKKKKKTPRLRTTFTRSGMFATNSKEFSLGFPRLFQEPECTTYSLIACFCFLLYDFRNDSINSTHCVSKSRKRRPPLLTWRFHSLRTQPVLQLWKMIRN